MSKCHQNIVKAAVGFIDAIFGVVNWIAIVRILPEVVMKHDIL